MNPYELLLIITPDHDETEAETLTNQVKGIIEAGGTILKVDPWGKRRLAYPIRKRSEGYYVLYIFESPAGFVAEINRSLHVIEPILRYMIVQYQDDIDKLKAELAAEADQVEAPTPTPDAEPPSEDDDAEPEETPDETAAAEEEETTESA